MTKWDRLLVQLDKVFGFQDRKRSTVKKRRQNFDGDIGHLWGIFFVRRH